MRVNTRYINSTRGTSSMHYVYVPVVEFMDLVFTRMPRELPWVTEVFVVC